MAPTAFASDGGDVPGGDPRRGRSSTFRRAPSQWTSGSASTRDGGPSALRGSWGTPFGECAHDREAPGATAPRGLDAECWLRPTRGRPGPDVPASRPTLVRRRGVSGP